MAEDLQQPNLHLTPDERRLFGHLFSVADADKIGVVTGERAVSFFEKTRLPAETLGEIWQIADTENRGLLTPAGFGMVMRLIGYAQAGRTPSHEMGLKPGGPLPRFDGIAVPAMPGAAAPLQAQNSGPIRVPPLPAERVAQYTSLFEESGAQNGILAGDIAKSIFERSQLPNEILGRIWALADAEQKGSLGLTEFIVAMHLIASMKSGAMRALPQLLPPGLYEAASRRGTPQSRAGARITSDASSVIPRQFSGQAPLRQSTIGPSRPVPAGGDDVWVVTPQEKAQFDSIFATVDTTNRGFITGDQAVTFFSNSRLSEEALAQIWDLADINSEGQLNRDEFAVAMYLIRQQRSKTLGRDILPAQLPPQLIPPSFRRQPVAPPHHTAPVFDNKANAAAAPKSASDDLFGLDAAPTPPPAANAAVAPAPKPSSPVPSAGSPATHFRPFVPSSTFGQAIMTPQGTDSAAAASPVAATRAMPEAQKPSASDDLLGDNDPEVSKKLTSDTSDLANLSNQVGTLTGQMQEIRTKRGATDQEYQQAQAQKRQFESRLAELRTAYEQELREVRLLEENLKTTKIEVSKLQTDSAMLQGTYEDLQNQRRQMSEALAADQTENATLREKIRALGAEVEGLKPQLEKIKSDARHQRGLVAINKKQYATHEFEKTRVTQDMQAASKDHEDATREAQESQRELEAAQSMRAAAVVSPPPAVASPAPSTASMNPFMRRNTSNIETERGGVSAGSPAHPTAAHQQAFDSFFNQTAGENTATRNNLAVPAAAGETLSSPEESTLSDNEPPAPPKSRQITSSFLPLRPNLERSGSESSSVKVVPPASRMGDRDTTLSQNSPSVATTSEDPREVLESATQTKPAAAAAAASDSVPGAFPGDEVPAEKPPPFSATDFAPGSSGIDPRINAGPSTATEAAAKPKDDFDSAFDGFASEKGSQGVSNDPFASEPDPTQGGREFPPIKELPANDSDSESEKGFDDDFAKSSGKNNANDAPIPTAEDGPLRPPTVNAQKSPPPYDEHPTGGKERSSSQDFPQEYSGLLPSRSNEASPSSRPLTKVNSVPREGESRSAFAAEHAPMAPGASTNVPYAFTNTNNNAISGEPSTSTNAASVQPSTSAQPPAPPPKAEKADDFDFDDLAPAQEEDEKGDDTLNLSQHSNELDFNPVFDSPRTISTSGPAQSSDAFGDFHSNTDGSNAPFTRSNLGQSQTAAQAPEQIAPGSHDWDAIFAGLDAPPRTNGAGNNAGGAGPPAPPTSRPLGGKKPSNASRTDSVNADDDPILKRLIGMGFARGASLSALEKYDYNIDKAAEYLLANGS